MRIFLIAYTAAGAETAGRLARALRERGEAEADCRLFERVHAEGFTPFGTAAEIVRTAFAGQTPLVFLCAAGIAVRCIAPFVKDKKTDPPVLVIDETGKYVIPILSGHYGGGNELAVRCASALGAEAVITTATDRHRKFAVDVFARKNGLEITDWKTARDISAAVLEGHAISVCWDGTCVEIPHLPDGCRRAEADGISGGPVPSVHITPFETGPEPGVLHLVPKQVTVGIGCRKGVSEEDIRGAVTAALKKIRLDPRSVAAVASADLKREEPGLRAFAEHLGVPFRTFPAQELAETEGTFTASEFVRNVTGVDNVCERSAVCAARQRPEKGSRFRTDRTGHTAGHLILPKTAVGPVTVAAALIPVVLCERKTVAVFGGTREGRALAELLESSRTESYVSVATAYGREVLPEDRRYCRIAEGRMDEPEMEMFFRNRAVGLVLDATHPYAVEVSANIRRAAERTGIPCYRIVRGTTPPVPDAVYVGSAEEAAELLRGETGNVLLTTGSKELQAFTAVPGYAERIYVRMLPLALSRETAAALGWREDRLLLKKGPFSAEENLDDLRRTGAAVLVTKDSGAEGGMPEKVEAARRAGCRLVIIRRPREDGISLQEAENILKDWKNGAIR